MKIFKLEEYLAKYEFSAPYLLCCSDAESWKLSEIISMADKDDIELWNNLHLGYTEPYGHPKLRAEIAKMYPGMTSENILCFAGAGEGIFCALHCLIEKDDHVIVLTPCYQSLLEIPQSKGARVTTIALREENDWRINLDVIKSSIKSSTRCIVINFPHNPTGQVITQEELKELVQICERNGIYLFSDEVYRLLGSPTEGWSSPAACLYNKALSLNVMSKAFGMAGLRIGWIACQDKQLLQKLSRTKDYLSICNSGLSEVVSIIALKNKDRILEKNNDIVSKNLTILEKFFEKYHYLFECVRPQGGCLGFVKYNGKENIDDFCDRLVQAKGVLLMPASIYDYTSNHFRLGFGRSNMATALEKLTEFLYENIQS